MSDLLPIALDAATQAGQLIKSNFGSDLTVNEMQRHDIKLELDVRSQKLITEIILKNDSTHAILGEEYGGLEKVNVLRGLLDMFSVLYPQLQGVDLRRDAPRLEVPVIVLEGSNELAARVRPAREWFELLEAPRKELRALPDAGHSVAFEQADELHRILLAGLRDR